jgi:hypothetical protein
MRHDQAALPVMPVKGAGGGHDQPFDVVEVGQVPEPGNGRRLPVAIEDGALEAGREGGLDVRGPVIDEQLASAGSPIRAAAIANGSGSSLRRPSWDEMTKAWNSDRRPSRW